MDKIVSFAKRRGFIFQSSEIYGGVEAIWDYGPLGSLLKNNIKRLWIKKFIQERDDIVLIDSSVILHPKVWEASGHIENFTDPLIECKSCHSRFRADYMAEGAFLGQGKAKEKNQCPLCGGKEFTPPRQFNLMFKTFLGPVEDESHLTFLRPETAQSMFLDFNLVLQTLRLKIPFGIGQIGKAFRNEITTGNFIFRSREFEIGEIEYFVEPKDDEKFFDYWVKEWKNFIISLGIKEENLRLYEHKKESLAHYSKRTMDIEYKFPFGWGELAGIANRTDFDLKAHSKMSGKDLSYFDDLKKKRYIPFVIEPTLGIDRLFLAILCDAFEEIKGGRTITTQKTKEVEILLKLNKNLAPIQIAVFPLLTNKEELIIKSKEICKLLKNHFFCEYDENGSIGRRYRRFDEIGCPFAVTIDFQTLEDDTVTVRDRDTMFQERIKVSDLISYFKDKFNV